MFNFLEFSDKGHFFKKLQFLRVESHRIFSNQFFSFSSESLFFSMLVRNCGQTSKPQGNHLSLWGTSKRHQQPLVSNNRGSAGERETPEHWLPPYCAIASALGSGPDLPVVPVSGGKNPARVGKAWCRHSYSPKSKQASIYQSGTWNVPHASQHQGFPAFVCVRSHTGVVGNSEEMVTKKVLLIWELPGSLGEKRTGKIDILRRNCA